MAQDVQLCAEKSALCVPGEQRVQFGGSPSCPSGHKGMLHPATVMAPGLLVDQAGHGLLSLSGRKEPAGDRSTRVRVVGTVAWLSSL